MERIIILAIIFSCVYSVTALDCNTISQNQLDGKDCQEFSDCGILNSPNTYYILTQDVYSDTTCIWISAEDITLDLNSHIVFYDQMEVPRIHNGDFEEDSMTGWDLSSAPGWNFATEIKSINERTLHLPNPGGSTVYSPIISIPSDTTFISSVFVNGLETQSYNVALDFVDADTDELIPPQIGPVNCRSNEANKDNDKELSGICNSITSTSPMDIKIRITTTGPMLIDYLDFKGFLHPAIASKKGWINPSHQYFSTFDMPDGLSDVSTIDIKNGNVVQGNARSGKAMSFYGAEQIKLQNLRIIMQEGADNRGIEQITEGSTNLQGGHEIINITLEVPSVGVYYRDFIGAALMLNGQAVIKDNTIRTDTAGILLNPDEEYVEGTVVSNNLIEMGFEDASMARNHYGIWVSRFTEPEISNNILTGSSHGGINIHRNIRGKIFNNTITMWGDCGLRFSSVNDRISIKAMEMYDYSLGEDENHEGYENQIYNNNITVIADSRQTEDECRVEIAAFNLRNRYPFDQSSFGNNLIYNNIFTSLNYDSLSSYGRESIAISLNTFGYIPENKEKFYNNVIQSNNLLIKAGMHETVDESIIVFNNTFKKLDIGVYPETTHGKDSFENIFVWESGGLTLRDNIWLEGASKTDFYSCWHTGIYKAENTLKVLVTDGNNPLSGTPVTLRNNGIVNQGETNSDGTYTTVVTDFIMDCPLSGRSYQDITLNPYTLEIEYNNQLHTQEVYVNQSTFIEIVMDSDCIHPADNNPCDRVVSITELIAYINSWIDGDVSLQDVMGAIVEWKG